MAICENEACVLVITSLGEVGNLLRSISPLGLKRTTKKTTKEDFLHVRSPRMSDVVTAIKEKLTASLGATHVDVTDTSGGCGSSVEEVVVSEAFRGKPMLAQHRFDK